MKMENLLFSVKKPYFMSDACYTNYRGTLIQMAYLEKFLLKSSVSVIQPIRSMLTDSGNTLVQVRFTCKVSNGIWCISDFTD